MSEVLKHPWLRDLKSELFMSKKVEHPIKPKTKGDPHSLDNFKNIQYVSRIDESIQPEHKRKQVSRN